MGFTNYIQQIKDTNNTTHDLVDTSASHYVKGTQTGSTNAWTGALPDGVSAYYDGLSIDYFLPYAGTSTAATLNLGSKGAKPIYIGNGTTQVTTHYPQYSVIHLTYIINSNLNSGNGCWKADAFYNTNSGGTITSVKTTAGTHSTINVSSGAAEFNVPTKTSHLTNDSGFITNAGVTSITTSAGTHTTKSSATGAVSFNVPTKTSHLTNDSGFLTSDTKVTQAYSTTNNNYPILMTATAGVSSTSSRGDTTAILNNQIYANPSTGMIAAKHGKFTFLETEDLQTNTATVMGMLDVKGELHTNKWTSTSIANVGGSFYISPTYKTATAKFQFTGGSAHSRTFKITGSFGSDSSSGLGVSAWTANSVVLVTGSVTYNNTTYPLGTCKGALNAVLSTTVATIKTVDSEALEMLYSIFSTTEVDAIDIEISLLTIGGTKPVGILLTSYGTSQSTYLDIYGGTNTNTGTPSVPNADPNLRIGYLGDGSTNYGLEKLGGSSEYPKGWGIYTDNGYFKGTVVADSGVIGGCTINNGYLEVPTARIQNFSANAIFAVTGAFSMLSSGVITTNPNRTTYDSTLAGLTLDMNGIGAGNGTSNTFKVVQSTGILTAIGATLKTVNLTDEQDNIRAIVDSGGLTLYDGTSTDSTNPGDSIAIFGTTSQIGRNSDNHLTITNDYLDLTNSEDVSIFNIDTQAGSLDVDMTAKCQGFTRQVNTTTAYTNTYTFNKTDISKVILAMPIYITFRNVNLTSAPSSYVTSNCTATTVAVKPYIIRIIPNQGSLTSIGSNYTCYVQTPNTGGGGSGTSVPYMRITIQAKYISTSSVQIITTIQAQATPSMPFVITIDNNMYIKYSSSILAPAYTIGNRTMDDGITNGGYSVAMGFGLKASYPYQIALGRYNENKDTSILEIGKGTGDNARSNIFEIQNNGRIIIPNNISYRGYASNGTDSVQIGYVSTGDKVMLADDDYTSRLRGTTIELSSSNVTINVDNILTNNSYTSISGSSASLSSSTTYSDKVTLSNLAAGLYFIQVSATFASKSGGRRGLKLTGSSDISGMEQKMSIGTTGEIVLHISGIVRPTSATTYTIKVFQDSGSAINCSVSGRYYKLSN